MSVSFNAIWIKELYMAIAPFISGKYGIAYGQSLLEDGMVSPTLCKHAVTSAEHELCKFKSC